MSKDYATNLFKGRRATFEQPLVNLNHLKTWLNSKRLSAKYENYVAKIIDKYSIINHIRPQYFESLHSRYFSGLTESDLQKKIKYKGKKAEFYKHIVNAMRYDAVRDMDFLPYIKQLGLKTCVYCNAHLAITTEDSLGVLSGKYELDHFLPKSKYPFLCTSFFNLQPCCSHCNKSKNNKDSLFGLYTTHYHEISPFTFALSSKSVIKYMLTQNSDDIDIIFDCSDSNLKRNHEKLFHITELYSTQKDVAEEIIWKAKVYNGSYKKSLEDSFSKLFPRTTNFNRLILGNYDNPHHCHKRPLAKFMQDIARQLKLI